VARFHDESYINYYILDKRLKVDGKMVIRKKNYAIIRVYSEVSTREAADKIGQKIIGIVYSLAK
jgi:hypothetical protein